MLAYAQMIKYSTKRGLESSNWAALQECINNFEVSLKVFESELGYSHYPLRCRLHLAIAYLYQARLTKDPSILFAEALENIRLVLKSDICQTAEETGNNKRILAEALALKSYALRKLPAPDPNMRTENIEEAIKLAEHAVRLSSGMKQLLCENLIALGLAFQEKYMEAQKKQDELVGNRTPPKRRAYNEASTRIIEEMSLNKLAAEKKYLEVLELNDSNDRLVAIAYLRLAEIKLCEKRTTSVYRTHLLRKIHPM